MTLWIIAGVLAYLCTGYVLTVLMVHRDGGEIKDDEHGFLIAFNLLWLPILAALLVIGIIVLPGFLYEEAKKKGFIKRLYAFK